jgi:hypothetical protein
MKTYITSVGACLLLLLAVGALSPAQAKIYVWKDANGRVHYVSDPIEVPQRILDDEERYRVIETTIVPSSRNNARTSPSSSVRTAVTPPSVPTSGRGGEAGARSRLQALQTEYRNLLKQMREFRKKHKNLRNSEYKQMQRKVLDLRRQMAEARKALVKK